MPSQNSSSSSQSPRAKRMVTVDGVRYSLNTGDKLGPAVARRVEVAVRPSSASRRAARVGDKPLPKAVRVSGHQQAVMHPDPKLAAARVLHPHGVTHPALPVPHQIENHRRIERAIAVPCSVVSDGREKGLVRPRLFAGDTEVVEEGARNGLHHWNQPLFVPFSPHPEHRLAPFDAEMNGSKGADF